MYANIADKMSIQQEDLKRRQHGWTMDEPQLDIIHLMTYMRQRASNASVFLFEFFRDYDPHRRGFISDTDFFRGVDAVRCFSDMSIPERYLLLHTFSERRPNNFKKQVSARGSPIRMHQCLIKKQVSARAITNSNASMPDLVFLLRTVSESRWNGLEQQCAHDRIQHKNT